MNASDTPRGRRIMTVGHSNHDEPTLLALLQQHEVQVLADVRSQPYSKYTTHFNSDQIKPALAEAGINYVFLGKELGGRPAESDFYDADGHVRYDLLAASPLFLKGIERLEKGIQNYRVAMMCSEENPLECHRHLLVGRVLAERGIELVHIRGDGRLQTNHELIQQSHTSDHRQQFLFDELKEPPWRSIRSVLPKQRPASSLED
jgi:uncharacterized protein (DUF488 family)